SDCRLITVACLSVNAKGLVCMSSLKKSWWAVAGMAMILTAVVGRLMIPAGGEETASPSLKMNLEPVTANPDPGPEQVVGAESGKGKGTSFPWVDVAVEGACKEYRIYFDRIDNENFHFLDRQDNDLTLGLCEGGVEQIFARAQVE